MMNYVVEYGRTLSPTLVHFGHSKLVSVSELWVKLRVQTVLSEMKFSLVSCNWTVFNLLKTLSLAPGRC